jgi:hypothetical protein
MIAITTFSATGYQHYAKRMLESVIENWPGKIIVYTESPIDLKHEKIEERSFFDISGVEAFYQYLKNVPLAHGKTENGYNYNYDAWKFTRKVFAQYDVLKEHKGKAFWLDADCVVTRVIDEQQLSALVEDFGLTYLGRQGFYTETGLIGFNTESEGFDQFLDKYIGCLRKGTLFTLRRWHDCEAFDWARSFKHCKENNLSPWFDLSKMPHNASGKAIMTSEQLDVIARSVLGQYITHHKGPRKMIAAAHAVTEQISETAQ